jgi:hypothetical protein
MNSDRIRAIQSETAHPESRSVAEALHKVWNETMQKYRQNENKTASLKLKIRRLEKKLRLR